MPLSDLLAPNAIFPLLKVGNKKQMIDAESPADVLSDDTIVQRLKDAGIDIARRTIAKYREAMKIPSSVQRRREKQSSKLAD